jgi:hypothetical protein
MIFFRFSGLVVLSLKLQSRNVETKMYTTIIYLLFCMGVELTVFSLGKNIDSKITFQHPVALKYNL